MPEAITVLAKLRAKDGMYETVKNDCLALVEPTRSEEGCIIYDFHQDTDDPASFMFYEQWVSKQALDEHLRMPYLQAFFSKAEELLDGQVDVTIYEKLS